MSERNLFRSAATRRFDGGAGDTRFTPAGRAHWAIVIAAALLVAAGVIWAIFGSAQETVAGQGYLLPENGLTVVVSDISGVVTDIDAVVGAPIEPGDPIAVVATDDGESVVRSVVAGTVLSVQRDDGDWVSSGDDIVIIAPNEPTVVQLFVPLASAGLVDIGMRAQVTFDIYSAAEYGTLAGAVQLIETLPATPGTLDDVLHDQALIDEIASLGAVVRMVIALDTGELERFAAAVGSEPRVASPVGARIIIETDAPIAHLVG